MVKDRRGSVGGGGHEERGRHYRTLCFHTNARVSIRTAIRTRANRHTVGAHEGTQAILAPGGQFHKQAYV